MPLYALEDVDDALDATKAFLWPIDGWRWLKLAFVAFFVGGPGLNLNTLQSNVPTDPGTAGGEFAALPDAGLRFWLLVGGVVAAALLLGLLFLLVGSIMEFVLVESLRREEIAVRRYWGRYWPQGVRLFAFRLVLGLLVLAITAAFVALLVFPGVLDGGSAAGTPLGDLSPVGVLALVLVVLVLAMLVGLFNGFTTVFVVPIMILDDCGVLAGWRRLWPTIAANPGQYLAYAIAGFLLGIGGGIVAALLVLVGLIALVIPFGILGAVGFGLATAVPPLGIALLFGLGAVFVVAVLALVALAQVPVVTYLRYYALLVLGDVDDDLDLVAERRAAVRGTEP